MKITDLTKDDVVSLHSIVYTEYCRLKNNHPEWSDRKGMDFILDSKCSDSLYFYELNCLRVKLEYILEDMRLSEWRDLK